MACFPETLEETLRSPFDTLKFKCRSCEHVRHMEGRRAIAVFGPLASRGIVARRRFRCTVCKSTETPIIWI